jgi:hypothetical protein
LIPAKTNENVRYFLARGHKPEIRLKMAEARSQAPIKWNMDRSFK